MPAPFVTSPRIGFQNSLLYHEMCFHCALLAAIAVYSHIKSSRAKPCDTKRCVIIVRFSTQSN